MLEIKKGRSLKNKYNLYNNSFFNETVALRRDDTKMNEFYTILKEEKAEVVEKKSTFIATAFYIESVEKAEENIKSIKKKYHDAKHNCIAYRVIENEQIIEKSSDDGEPSGTAGGPMLNILQKNNLCNILVIVTRYFGGILLGTGGLVRAYTEATQKVIERTTLIYKVDGIEAEVKIDYSNLEIFKYYCKNNDINIMNIEYFEDIVLKIQMEKNRKNIFLEDIKTKKLKIKEIQIRENIYINKTVEKNK